MPRHQITRRQALRAGALGALLGAAGLPSPTAALATGPALFEADVPDVGGDAGAAGWRTTRVLRAPRRFDLIGLRWEDGSHVRAEVRARRRSGEWTPWLALHALGDHGPDAGTTTAGTDPAFTGTADEYQLRLLGRPRGLRARFVRALPTATLAHRTAAHLRRRASASRRHRRHGAEVPSTPFPLITRREWGADAVPPRTDPAYGDVQAAFVHHTVNANSYRRRDSPAIVLGIARFHIDSNGWDDIGYNFLVDRYGQVFEGRAGGIDQPVVGAQAQGYNAVSTGIACIGTFESVGFTRAGLEALARVIGWKLSTHNVPVRGSVTVISAGGDTNRHPAGTEVRLDRVSGHRDGDTTTCPGAALYGELPALRRRARRHRLRATALSAHAGAAKVDPGTAVAFSGALYHAAAGAEIAVQYRPPGEAWRTVATAITGGDGEWRVSVIPPATGVYRAAFAGDGSRDAVYSRPRRVEVVPQLSVGLDHRHIRHGRRVEITGRVDPSQQVLVVIERRVGGRWKTGTSQFVDARHGRFHLRQRLKTRGRYRVTVIAGGTRSRRRLRVD